ncbi:aminotransferase class V-fold PLP-dependent enzyme [Nocardioides sp.]|uniref:aminotransferase class I/II-fold pyridoxal phosphate-dependent enzyme n=1 Tax=Nocardioides sp. TaxID=35761 RepID=UPI0026290906|nr:aminotransferase class V-fold PLP-dependent enzyme [Nocardioides sp.]
MSDPEVTPRTSTPTPPLTSSLLDGWSRFMSSPGTPFMIPGHKQRAGLLWPELGDVNRGDVPLFGGLATLKDAAGVLAAAEARTATRWGADWCRYSTGGSTHANQVLALSVGTPGDEVLVARNAHRSTLSGLLLAGLTPRWLTPTVSDGLITELSVATVEAAIARHPRARALFLVEPSYVGTLSDREALIATAHAAGLTVVVDQAWGAHLGFHEDLPAHGIALGADAVIFSAHKTLPAYSQASVVLARTERLDAGRLERAFDLSATTSPAGSLLASTDAAVTLLDSPLGHQRLGVVLDAVSAARATLREAGLSVAGPDTHRMDPTKLVVRLPDGGLDLEQRLIAAGLAPEQADETTVIPIVTLADRPEDLARFTEVVLEQAAEIRVHHRRDPGSPQPRSGSATDETRLPTARMTPRDAFFADTETVPAAQALGRISAEVIAPYPPGVPVLVPGEEITPETVELLQDAAAAGVRIAYAADPTLATFQVVAVP